MDHGALDDALEAGGRLGILVVAGDQIVELGIDVVEDGALEFVEVDVAGAHDSGGFAVVDQGQQEMLERREFVVALIGESQRLMQSLFQALGERRHL